ncbi:hypothetical protein [Streptomyces sp. NPDC054834]
MPGPRREVPCAAVVIRPVWAPPDLLGFIGQQFCLQAGKGYSFPVDLGPPRHTPYCSGHGPGDA